MQSPTAMQTSFRTVVGARLAVFIAMAGLSAALLSCTGNSYGPQRDSVEGSARHGMHHDELRTDMRGLERRSKEDIAAEIYTGNPVSMKWDDISDSAGAIAETADHIPDYLDGSDLDAAERREFVALAQELSTRARHVQAQARTGNAESVRKAVDQMNNTCQACHTRFRF